MKHPLSNQRGAPFGHRARRRAIALGLLLTAALVPPLAHSAGAVGATAVPPAYFQIDLPAKGLDDPSLDDENRDHRNWLLGLIGTHNFGWGLGWAPGPFGIGGGLIAYEANLGLKAVPPVLEAPSRRAVDVPRGTCFYRLEATHNEVETFEDYLGFGPPFRPGQPGLDANWGELGTPTIYHANTNVDVETLLDGAPFGLPDYGARSLGVGRHTIEWRATNLITPITDLVPWFLLNAFSVADAAKKTGNTKILLDLAQNAVLTFGPAAGATLAGLAGERTEWHKTRRQDFWVLDKVDPELRLTRSRYAVEALDVGGRVFNDALEREIRESALVWSDECGREVEILVEAPDFLPVGRDIPIVWRALDPGPDKREPADRDPDDPAGSRPDDLRNETRRTMTLEIRDTLPPILEPPRGKVVESNRARTRVELGRPGVFDIADPKASVFPRVGGERVNRRIEVDQNSRTKVVWTAKDNSGNTSRKVQWLTVKAPGTNTRPRALGGEVNAISFEPQQITLRGQDDDLIDGRYDQLSFEIARPPRHGNFVAPLFPYFIDDYRVAATLPEGLPNDYYTDSDVDGDGLLSKPELDALFDRWCEETPNEMMPRSFVTNPRYMSINDRGEMYVSDDYNLCDGAGSSRFHNVRPRLARFDELGNILAEVKLNQSQEVDSLFIDHRGFAYFVNPSVSASEQTVSRIDPTPSTFNSGPGEPPLMDQTVFQIRIPPNDQGLIDPWGKLQSVVVDRNGVMYVTDGNSVYAFDPEKPISPGSSQPTFLGTVVEPFALGSGRTTSDYLDMTVDSRGHLYLSDEINHRIWKYGPSSYDPATGEFVPGERIGWLGRCAGNLTEKLACDTGNQRSFGFRCTDETCRVDTGARDVAAEHAACGLPVPPFLARNGGTARAGCEPGQLHQPRGLAMGPRDTLYVADYSNFRIQRFTAEGSFGGEAKSECDGTCFVLGDFGRPRDVTVNRDNFYVLDIEHDWLHIFETTPVTNVDDESQRVTQRAYVTYQSDNNFRGRDSFRFRTSDGLANSAPGTVNIDVARNHRPPETINLQPVRTFEDRAVDFELAAVDPDEDELSFRIVRRPSHGELTGEGRRWTYTPEKDFAGQDSFVYVANDGLTSSPALDSPQTEVILDVEPVPDPPVFRDLELVNLTGRGYTNTLRADLYEPDQQDRLRVVVDWGDGTVVPAEPPPAGEGAPMLVQGGASARVTASHHYRANGRYTVRVCASDVASAATLTSCTSPDVTALRVETIEVRDMADLQLAVSEDLPKYVEPDCPPDVDEDGNCPLRSEAMTDGQPVRYTVDVFNPELNGVRPTATGVEVSVDIPENFVLSSVSAAGPGGSVTPRIEGNQVLVRYSRLAAEDMGTITLDGRTDGSYGADGELELVATANGEQLDPTDKNRLEYTSRVEADPSGDADGDGVANGDDLFPQDPTEWADLDGDGVGDNRDADDDNDLMPDAWEERYGLDPKRKRDRNGDLDGDGLNNRDEFLAGTDPTMADTDLDLVTDASDNCPVDFNADQTDLDADGDGNACDPDFATHSAKLGDLNGNGTSEIAIMSRASNGVWRVQVFDTAEGERLARFQVFGPRWTGLDLDVLRTGGTRELVALAVAADGAAQVAILDPLTGRARERFDVFGPAWTAIDLAVVPQLATRRPGAIAVLGRKRDGTIAAEVRRATDGKRLRKTRFFDAEWRPRRILAVADIDDDGGHELAVLAEHPDGRIATAIKTARGGFKLRTDFYFDESWRFRDFVDLGDANGRGYDELAVLAQRRNGRHAVVLRDAGTGRELSQVAFPGNGWSAARLGTTPDTDGSGARELAVLMQRDDGRIRVQTRDAISGAQIGLARYLAEGYLPQGLLTLPAAQPGGGPGLTVIATRGTDGRTKLQTRDAVSGEDSLRFVVP